jgi:hypothetical protein
VRTHEVPAAKRGEWEVDERGRERESGVRDVFARRFAAKICWGTDVKCWWTRGGQVVCSCGIQREGSGR